MLRRRGSNPLILLGEGESAMSLIYNFFFFYKTKRSVFQEYSEGAGGRNIDSKTRGILYNPFVSHSLQTTLCPKITQLGRFCKRIRQEFIAFCNWSAILLRMPPIYAVWSARFAKWSAKKITSLVVTLNGRPKKQWIVDKSY